MFDALNCDIVVSEFKLQSRYYIYFQTNILGKTMKYLIFPSYRLNSTTTVPLQRWLSLFSRTKLASNQQPPPKNDLLSAKPNCFMVNELGELLMCEEKGRWEYKCVGGWVVTQVNKVFIDIQIKITSFWKTFMENFIPHFSCSWEETVSVKPTSRTIDLKKV